MGRDGTSSVLSEQGLLYQIFGFSLIPTDASALFGCSSVKDLGDLSDLFRISELVNRSRLHITKLRIATAEAGLLGRGREKKGRNGGNRGRSGGRGHGGGAAALVRSISNLPGER